MANASYDTLTITINADSKEANRNIRQLSNNLNKLNDSATKLNTRRLGEVRGLLLNIAKIDFSNVSKGLQDVVSAFKYFQNKTAQRISPVFSTFNKGSGLNFFAQEDKNIASYVRGIEKMNFSLGEVGAKAPQVKEVAKAIRQVGDEAKKSEKKGRGFGQMLLNIARYRLVRRLIQEIFQEIQQGIQQLALEDEDFNEAMSIITSSISYIARSLVSVIAPVIKAIAPIIELLAQSLNEVANTLGSSLAGSLGETFYEASESVDDYAESIKKAKSATMGFDELNIISQDKSGGFEIGEAKEMSGALGELFARLTTLTKELLDQLTPQISTIMFAIVRALEKAVPLIVDGTELAVELVSLTDDGVNNSVANFIEMLGSALKLTSSLIKMLKPFLSYLVWVVSGILNIINQILSVAFLIVNTFTTFFEAFAYTIPNFFQNGFEGVKRQWQTLLNDMSIAWANFGTSLLNPIINVVKNILGVYENVVNTIVGYYNSVASFFNLPTLPAFVAPSVDNIGYINNNPISYGNQGSGGSGSNNNPIKIYIDGKEITKVVNKENDNRGANFFYGGTINYGR